MTIAALAVPAIPTNEIAAAAASKERRMCLTPMHVSRKDACLIDSSPDYATLGSDAL
jgi:hypothetical protein